MISSTNDSSRQGRCGGGGGHPNINDIQDDDASYSHHHTNAMDDDAEDYGNLSSASGHDDTSTIHLRIISTNDVYELDNWPRAKTAIDYYRNNAANPDNTIFILAGDFLSPSALSTIDKGKSMVDVMNKCGVDYVCFGNHESDLTIDELASRIQESNFTWINTNMPHIPLPSSSLLPKHHVILNISTTAAADKHSGMMKHHDSVDTTQCCRECMSVYLLGLLTEDESLYKQGAFGGAEIKPVLETVMDFLIMKKRVKQQGVRRRGDRGFNKEDDDDDDDVAVGGGGGGGSVNCYNNNYIIIPITHQSMRYDRALAKALNEYYHKTTTTTTMEQHSDGANKKLYQPLPQEEEQRYDGDDGSGGSSSNASCRVPLIIGGHDHDAYVEDVDGVTIAKAGCDVENILVFDLTWRRRKKKEKEEDKYNHNNNNGDRRANRASSSASSSCSIRSDRNDNYDGSASEAVAAVDDDEVNNNDDMLLDIFVNLVPVSDFEPDPEIQCLVDEHMSKLDNYHHNNTSSVLPLISLKYSILCDEIDLDDLMKCTVRAGGGNNTNDSIMMRRMILLSSKNIRLHQTTIGTFIASSIRDGISLYSIAKTIRGAERRRN
ncbi:hypothetical protein FOZ63_030680, partial [Perkinsus olseni]